MKILIAILVIGVVMLMEGFGIWLLLGLDSREPSHRGKLFWLAVLALTHWIGAAVYYAFRKIRPVRGAGLFSRDTVSRLREGMQPHRSGA